MSGPRDDAEARERAASLARQQIMAVSEALGATWTEEPIPGYQVLTRRVLDDPLVGVRAAVLVRNVADGAAYDAVRDARAAGRSWDEVADALGIADEQFLAPRGQRAFEEVTGRPDLFHAASIRWTCTACGQRVSDTGPYESHPSDDEHGHAETCERHTAAVAAWQQRMGEDL